MTRRLPSVPCSTSLYCCSMPNLPAKSPGRSLLLLANLTHVAHGVREKASRKVAPPLNGDHFENLNVRLVRLDKGYIRGRGVRLDDDGLKFGEALRVVQLFFQIRQRNAQAVGNSGKMLFHLTHVVAQKQHAEGRPVVYENAAVAVQHAAAGRDDRDFADAVAFGESSVLIRVNDLKLPEAQQ